MIFIGNDIVEISKINKLLKKYNNHFLRKVFSKSEIDIVDKKKHTSIHLSGKFAAKEAFKKAFMAAGFSGLFFKDIKILNKEDGAPYVSIRNFKKKYNVQNLQVSISHTDKYATAVVILDISH